MAYGESNGHVTNDVYNMTLKSQTRDLQYAQYQDNGWR